MTVADVEVAVGATDLLREFNEAGVLDVADVHVAQRLTALGAEPDESVALAVALTVRALRGGLIDINSREFIREMAALHSDEDMQDARAEHGAFDDRFMALGIIYFSMHILEFSGKAVDVSFLRNNRLGGPREKVMYQSPKFNNVSYRPDEEAKALVDTHYVPFRHPGTIDTSWEGEE